MGKWIVNSSPIIALSRIKKLSLLTQLSEKLVIPAEVKEELVLGTVDDSARIWIEQEGIKYAALQTKILPIIAAWDLGKGETAVLNMGYQNQDSEIIIDDKAARKCAKSLNI